MSSTLINSRVHAKGPLGVDRKFHSSQERDLSQQVTSPLPLTLIPPRIHKFGDPGGTQATTFAVDAREYAEFLRHKAEQAEQVALAAQAAQDAQDAQDAQVHHAEQHLPGFQLPPSPESESSSSDTDEDPDSPVEVTPSRKRIETHYPHKI